MIKHLKKPLTITLPLLYELQQDIKNSLETYRYVVVNLGRRSGKSILGTDTVITRALDTGHNTGWFSPSYKQLLGMYDLACSYCENIATFDRQNKRIKLINGANIEYWSLDKNIADNIRGRRYGHIVIDESAFIKGLRDTFYKVLIPTLVDYKGTALFLSSPNGYNDHYHMFRLQETDEQWRGFIASSYANPYLDKEELDRLKKALPDRIYRSEILAEFMDSETGVFTNISSLPIHRNNPTGLCSFGIDFARTTDNTAIAVMVDKHLVELEVINNKSFEYQLEAVISLYRRYKPEVVVVENNGLSQPLTERLVEAGLPIEPFITTNSSKKVIIENLAVAIEQGLISVQQGIENEQLLYNELAAYESKTTSQGMITYNAPSGYHDDTIIALALSYKIQREDDYNLVVY